MYLNMRLNNKKRMEVFIGREICERSIIFDWNVTKDRHDTSLELLLWRINVVLSLTNIEVDEGGREDELKSSECSGGNTGVDP